MAFSLGYTSLCDKNIQRIYTIRSLKPPARRKPREYKPEFIEDIDRRRRDKMRNKPFMEFVAKHGVDLPKAPAFRVVASEEVDHIVDRLTMKPSKRFPHFQYNKRDGGYNDWRTAHEEKIRRLRETLHMFGGGKETQPEEIEEEPKVKKTKKEKKRKKTYKEHVDDEIDTKKNGHLPGIN